MLNPVASLEQLEKSPSYSDGISPGTLKKIKKILIKTELEYKCRILSCVLIQQAGELLKIPQIAIATAQVLCQRYYYLTSLKRYKIQHGCRGMLNFSS